VRYKFATTCDNAPCEETVRTRVQKQIKKVGNIQNFPCQVLSVGVLYTFTLTSVTFLGFQPASK
jgi:trans-2-enoyl-CoA reductase